MHTIFKVYSDENRLKIIACLKTVPLTVSELKQMLNTTQANTSKHLKILLKANMVDYVKLGQSNFYYINNNLFDQDELQMHVLSKIANTYSSIKIEINISVQEIEQRRRIINSYINTDATNYNFDEIDITMISTLNFEEIYDIREPIEYQLNSIKGIKNIPLSLILNNIANYFEFDKHYYLICQVHTRSCHLAILLNEYGYNVSVIKGGIDGYLAMKNEH